MTSPNRWENMLRLPDPHAREVQMAYVDGYKMGIEEALRELNTLQASLLDREDVQEAATQELLRIFNLVFKTARKVIARRLVTANSAMQVLKGGPS